MHKNQKLIFMLSRALLLTRRTALPSSLRRWPAPPRAMTSSDATAAADVAVVYVTAPSTDVAQQIATTLVTDRLAACVNIVPGLTSVYRWQGKVEAEPEVLMMVKARRSELPALTAAIKAAHPYAEPEVLAVPAVGGSESYLDWVMKETAK